MTAAAQLLHSFYNGVETHFMGTKKAGPQASLYFGGLLG
jgi:hypothetical protein